MKSNRSFKMLSLLIVLFSFVGFGCSTTQTKKESSWQYPHIVNAEFVKPFVKVPAPTDVMLIDARPKRAKFDKGHIPTSVSIPDSQFKKMTDLLPEDKNTTLIFYCGGLKCKLSHKSAHKAEKLGYTNVKVYAAGYPDWMKQKGSYATVSVDFMKSQLVKSADMVVIDSRPKRMKYDKGHMPTAISIPDSKFAKMTDQLPTDKNKLLVFYCGGFKCKLSHKSAAKAINLGYKNVKVFAAGYPAWKKAVGSNAIKSGGEESSIDIAYFQKTLKNNRDSIMIIDVRDPDEFAAGQFPKAINIPTDQLEAKIPTLQQVIPIVFVCATGARSGEAYYMVQDLRPALKNVSYLEAEITYNADGSQTITAAP